MAVFVIARNRARAVRAQAAAFLEQSERERVAVMRKANAKRWAVASVEQSGREERDGMRRIAIHHEKQM